MTRAGAQLKSTGVADAVCNDKTRVRTPGEGSLSSGGGSAVDARRVDDGSLHRGGSVTKAGTQLRGVGVAKAVHRGDAGVRTPGEGSLSGGGGGAVDARCVDDGSLHRGGSETKAGIGSQHKQQEPTKSAGGLVGSRAQPQHQEKTCEDITPH